MHWSQPSPWGDTLRRGRLIRQWSHKWVWLGWGVLLVKPILSKACLKMIFTTLASTMIFETSDNQIWAMIARGSLWGWRNLLIKILENNLMFKFLIFSDLPISNSVFASFGLINISFLTVIVGSDHMWSSHKHIDKVSKCRQWSRHLGYWLCGFHFNRRCTFLHVIGPQESI